MIENTKCECGHQNHVGTLLCEACGNPLNDKDGTTPLEMRYDGVARRSQHRDRTVLDKIWNFFSSVKIAVYLIIFTLCGAAIGTIFPQENTFIDAASVDLPSFYKSNYGTLGYIYYLLGLTHTYSSWWFKLLLVMIGTSLVVCSLDRVLPLYRALSTQQVRKHLNFINRQKLTWSAPLAAVANVETQPEAWLEQVRKGLRRRRYKVYTDGTALMAEKNRFCRWGPYINHIGLIIFLLAALARSIPGWYMDQYIGVMEGDTVPIQNTPYYIKNEKFTVDYYSEDQLAQHTKNQSKILPKLYETKAVLYTCEADCDVPGKQPVLREVTRQNIIVNKPLEYKDLKAYQFDYEETVQLRSVKVTLQNKQTGEQYGQFLLKMKDPQEYYTAGSYKLHLKSYFPDFTLDEDGTPITQSPDPKAPAFVFIITGPGLPDDGEPYMYFPRQNDKVKYGQDIINGDLGKKLDFSVGSMNDVDFASYTSFLNIRVEKALPYIWFAAAISMIGLIMGFYWQHRRIWLRIDDGQLSLGAHTSKNWYGLRKEVAQVLGASGIGVDPKALEREV